MQAVTLEGYLAADPSCLTATGSDVRRARFRLVETTRYTRSDGERAERTAGFNCVCFADAVVRNYIEPYARKGTRVIVRGHVENDSWTDKEGGKHYDLSVIVEELRLKNRREPQAGEGGFGPGRTRVKPGMDSEVGGHPTDLDDEIPF